MKKLPYLMLVVVLVTGLAPSLMATPIVGNVVFLEYFGANGPALGGYLTGEYKFHVYAATQNGSGNLTSGSYIQDIAVWCLTPFALTQSGKVAFAIGNGSDIGQLHDVSGISDAEADSFYRDTTAMYLKYYELANTALRDDLQATIWERRDMIEGPSSTKSVNTFDLLAGTYDLGSSIPGSISSYTSFTPFLGLNSGVIGDIYTPLLSSAVASGDIQYGNYQYNYNHDKQEFGYQVPVPEPSSLLLLGGGMLLAAGFLRRKR